MTYRTIWPQFVTIDVKKVNELKKCSKSPLEIGGGVVLNEVIELMKTVASENEAYKYGNAIVDHLLVVSKLFFIIDLMYCTWNHFEYRISAINNRS